MHVSESATNFRPDFDSLLVEIADYTCDAAITSAEAFQTRNLFDGYFGLRLLALNYPACAKLLGPVVSGQSFLTEACARDISHLDPCSRHSISGDDCWLDFNDTCCAEWGILRIISSLPPVSDLSAAEPDRRKKPLTVRICSPP